MRRWLAAPAIGDGRPMLAMGAERDSVEPVAVFKLRW
jgi:hypothetical protein